MIFVSAIVVAAGKSTRCKSKISKPLLELGPFPVIIHSLAVFQRHPDIKEIIIVANTLNQRQILKVVRKFKIAKVKSIVLGGKERRDSVRNGLSTISPQVDLVLIHDAARPLINPKKVSALIDEARRSGAAILGVPVKETIKKVVSRTSTTLGVLRRGVLGLPKDMSYVVSKFIVRETLNRQDLWEIQTPQVFRKELILRAYRKFGKIKVTDDASLVERLGAKVSVVLGSHNNIKITTAEDLVIAEAMLEIKNQKYIPKSKNF